MREGVGGVGGDRAVMVRIIQVFMNIFRAELREYPRQASTARAAGTSAALATHGPARRLHALPGARHCPCRRRVRLSGRLVSTGDRGCLVARGLVRVL